MTLAATINAYWAARGRRAGARMERYIIKGADGIEREYSRVVSEMKNGWPPAK